MNNIKKVFAFVKKEAFYLVLLLCLCAIAVAAAISARTNAQSSKVSSNTTDNKITVNEQKSPSDKTNADLVKGEDKKEVADNNTNDKSNPDSTKDKNTTKNNTTEKAAPVSNVSEVKFIKPLSDGVITREYKETPVKIETLGNECFATIKGVSLKSAENKPVVAVADGKVTDVGDSRDNLEGFYVEISHSNGLKTVYANLDPSVSVKKGETVKQGQEIGKVGSSAISLKFDKIANDLQFQVINAKNEQVDPGKYVSFK